MDLMHDLHMKLKAASFCQNVNKDWLLINMQSNMMMIRSPYSSHHLRKSEVYYVFVINIVVVIVVVQKGSMSVLLFRVT